MKYEIELLSGRYHLIAYRKGDTVGRVMNISKGWKTYNGAKRVLDNFLRA